MLKGLTLVGGVIAASSAIAEDIPRTGILYHTTENSSLVFSCKSVSFDRINCEFNQTSVRTKLTEAEAAEKIAQERQQYAAKPEAMSKDVCELATALDDMLSGRKQAPKKEELASMRTQTKKEIQAFTDAALKFCRQPSMDNYLNLIRLEYGKQTKTCSVSSTAYKQTLSLADTNNWAVIPEATGDCGVIQLDRFEADKSHGITFWNYVARKVVRNPNARAATGLKCSVFDQNEYRYSWKKRDIDLNCEHIEFSPI